MFLKDGSRTQTLEARHNLSDRELGRKRTKDMHMIHTYFQFFDLDVVGLGNLQQQLTHPLTDHTCQNLLTVFGRSHQVVLGVINTVRAAPKSHDLSVAPTLSPAATPLHSFIPAASGGAF